MSDEMKNGDGYEMSAGCNETSKNRVASSLGVCVEELGVPFRAILNDLFLGEVMLSNLFDLTYHEVFEVLHVNLRSSYPQLSRSAQRPAAHRRR